MGGDKGTLTFPKGISATRVQYVSHYTTGTAPNFDTATRFLIVVSLVQ